MVAAKGDEYYFGSSAKIQTGKKNISTFKAFKMMLPEFREENLAARGYSRVNTPQSIAERFLSYCMREALKRTQAVILSPTRELCLQIAGDLKDYSRYIDHTGRQCPA